MSGASIINDPAKVNLPTAIGISIDAQVFANYMRGLVNSFFKILPLKEEGEASLVSYMKSLQAELLGCTELVIAVKHDALFIKLPFILQHLIDHPESPVYTYKREVFKAISICNNLKERYAIIDSKNEGV